jgi:hypothetical protein
MKVTACTLRFTFSVPSATLDAMLEFHPPRLPGRQVGLALIGAVLLVDLGLLFLLFSQPITFLSFLWALLLSVSLPALLVIASLTANLMTARYYVDGDLLIIEWGKLKRPLPLHTIRNFVPGKDLGRIDSFRGLQWPGLALGRARLPGEFSSGVEEAAAVPEDLFMFATRPQPQQLVVVADDGAYALTPQDAEDFVVCLRAMQDTGLATDDAPAQNTPGLLAWPIWGDRAAYMLQSVSILLNGALFAYLTLIYGRLPAETALHLDSSGMVSRTGSPLALFILPLIGLVAWLLNGFLAWLLYHFFLDRSVALIVWAATIVIQVTIWIAALTLLYAPW